MLDNSNAIYLVEEHLFFRQFQFHKQKLAFHRATMQFYASYLKEKGKTVYYISSHEKKSDIRLLIKGLVQEGVDEVQYINSVDNWLEKRIRQKVLRISCGSE